MGQGYYIVEISSNNTHVFIAAYDVESPESLLIELPDKRAQEILKEFDNDYEAMSNSLQVMNKRLVLLNPVSAFNLIFRNLLIKNDWVQPLLVLLDHAPNKNNSQKKVRLLQKSNKSQRFRKIDNSKL